MILASACCHVACPHRKIADVTRRTPSLDIYQKIRSSILGKSIEEELSPEETAEKLESVTVPVPDNTRACR